ncbi:MAG TPA: restriction endonuclease subunit S, partial [Mesotoga sp.]|nr:restriction endonuclease subunit S [Mesotoga sp.]
MGSRKLGFKKTDIGWIPEDWQLVQIRDLCSAVVNGGTPSREKSAYWNQGNIRWLKTQEIQDWYVWDTQERITELGLRESSAKMVPEKTIIVAMYGATAGRIAIAGCPLSTNQACCNLVVEPTKVYYLFLFYSLLTHRKRLIDFANGAAQQNLNQESVIALRIPVPAVPEQKRIALLFGSLDHKIELNRKINKTLEEIAWAIFKRWFIDFEFPN